MTSQTDVSPMTLELGPPQLKTSHELRVLAADVGQIFTRSRPCSKANKAQHVQLCWDFKLPTDGFRTKVTRIPGLNHLDN